MSDRYSTPAKRQTLSNSLLGILLKSVFTLVIAWVASIVIEVLGMIFWWPEEGVNHALRMYDYELSQLQPQSDSLVLSSTQYRLVEDIQKGHDMFIDLINIEAVLGWMDAPITDGDNSIRIMAKKSYVNIRHYVEAALTITKVFSLRLSILVLSLPLFVFAFIVGITDGFVERDLRRWGAGRESSTLFDLGKSSMGPMALGAWVIYLSLPVSINPSLIIIPFVFLFGLSVRVTAGRLKKYF